MGAGSVRAMHNPPFDRFKVKHWSPIPPRREINTRRSKSLSELDQAQAVLQPATEVTTLACTTTTQGVFSKQVIVQTRTVNYGRRKADTSITRSISAPTKCAWESMRPQMHAATAPPVTVSDALATAVPVDNCITEAMPFEDESEAIDEFITGGFMKSSSSEDFNLLANALRDRIKFTMNHPSGHSVLPCKPYPHPCLRGELTKHGNNKRFLC